MRNGSSRSSRCASRAVVTIVMLAVVGAAELPVLASAAVVSQRWVDQYGGGDSASAMGISPDGSTVFVTGSNGGRRTDGGDFVTVAYDAVTGTRRWVARYDSPADGMDHATALGVSADGSRVFVAGFSEGSSGERRSATVAYDATTGTELWAARRSFDGGFSVELDTSPDGSVVLVAGEILGARGHRSATVAYDAERGQELWVARRANGLVSGIDVSPDGSKVLVTGGTLGRSYSNAFATVAYDVTTGAELWLRRYGARHGGIAIDMGVSPDGATVFVTGIIDSLEPGEIGAQFDFATVAYRAATGSRLWERRFDGPEHREDFPQALAVSPNGSAVFVTGESFTRFGSAYATVAYDAADGAERWVARYDGIGDGQDSPDAIVVSPDGSQVFVTGWSRGDPAFDVATVGYDTTSGAELWAERFAEPGGSRATVNSLAMSPDGASLFVAGSTRWVDRGDATYTMIAYDLG